jgi:uncharacterized membrane protein
MDILKRLHRFLADQSFYPILLSSVYAMLLFIARVYISGYSRVYSNLVWNLFLAWVPYGFSMLAYGLLHISRRSWWLLFGIGFIWMLFFPNAPYILTDFFHLDERAGVPLWYDILLLIAFSWTGIFLMMASLRTMSRVVKVYLGRWASWLFAMFALVLSAIGIYLGRFERWNSWDMLTHPERILADVLRPLADPLNGMRFFGVTILFTAFLLVCYLVFISFDLPDEPA